MRSVRVSIVVIALALVATACGGDDSADTTTTSSSLAPVTTTTTPTTTAAPVTTTTTSAPRPQATALVAAIQLELTILGYYEDLVDGIYGPATVDALTAFQTDAGITADGQYGTETYGALAAALEADEEFVTSLQEDLTELELYTGDITGEYDEATEAGVVTLQEDCVHEPEPDGRFTPLTHVCLLEALNKL
jgi:peptidoglycan hydrolase-like protein with peptidoglycan-binding domain